MNIRPLATALALGLAASALAACGMMEGMMDREPAAQQGSVPATIAPAAVSADEFVDRAAATNLFEIRSSQLALERAQDEEARQFAQRMVQDHTTATQRLQGAAAAAGVQVPTSPETAQHQATLDQMQTASGEAFDDLYLQAQMQAHEQAIALFEAYAQNGDEPALKEFATNTLPGLRSHLETLRGISG